MSKFKDTFFTPRKDYNPRVILVSSNSLSVIEAKLKIIREFLDVKSPENIFIHHEYDDNDEVSKLSAFYKASFICDQIDLIRESMSEHKNYAEVFYEVLNIFLSSENPILKCCEHVLNEHALDIRIKRHANHELSINQLWLMFVENANKRACRSIGSLIYNKISVHSKLKL